MNQNKLSWVKLTKRYLPTRSAIQQDQIALGKLITFMGLEVIEIKLLYILVKITMRSCLLPRHSESFKILRLENKSSLEVSKKTRTPKSINKTGHIIKTMLQVLTSPVEKTEISLWLVNVEKCLLSIFGIQILWLQSHLSTLEQVLRV